MSTQLRDFVPPDSPLARRKSEFPSESAYVATAIARDPKARMQAERYMDSRWASRPTQVGYNTIIIGAGIHGITYALTTEDPGSVLVLDSQVVGGTFGLPRGPAFALNSRNRRGEGSVPGTSGALNYIPGGSVQPRDIGGQEYQSNWDLAFAIRCSALDANIEICAGRVDEITENEVVTTVGEYKADRIIIATGLGSCIDFQVFLNTIGQRPYPLKGFKKVAVIGAGDSGKVTVEALLGQTPYVDTTLDEVERIDWFGQQSLSKERFEICERSRYVGIARFFPRNDNPDYPSKIRPIPGRAKKDRKRAGMLLCDDRYYGPYDKIIECTGFKQAELVRNGPDLVPVRRNDMIVAMQYGDWPVYKVGPAANIPVEKFEVETLAGIPANSAAIFRYAPRTALFAKEG